MCIRDSLNPIMQFGFENFCRKCVECGIDGVIIPDLPFRDYQGAALDPKSSQRVMEITDRLVKEKGMTTLMVTHNLRFALEYGSRLLMMHEGRCILDLRGEEKKNASIDDLLKIFNDISIECGN